MGGLDRGLFCLSGSQQFVLMKNISETLSGRIRILELAGLSLREIQGDPFNERFLPTEEYVLERQESVIMPSNIWETIHRGSYPALQDARTEWAAFYSDYVRTYIERDVRELSAVQDLDAFRRFMVAAAARTGEILNYSNLADAIGKDVSTVKHWISILEASGIIYLLEPYAANVLKPVEIKQSAGVTPDATGAFLVLDKIEGKQRGIGTVVCLCPQPGLLRENVWQLPVWFI